MRGDLRFGLRLRNLEEITAERKLSVDHLTIWRWAEWYGLQLNRRCRPEFAESEPVIQHRAVPEQSAGNRRMIESQASLGHPLFYIPIAERIPQVPTYAGR